MPGEGGSGIMRGSEKLDVRFTLETRAKMAKKKVATKKKTNKKSQPATKKKRPAEKQAKSGTSNSKDKSASGNGFKAGNKFGGNPFAGRIAQLRSAMLNAVDEHDMEFLIQCLLKEARAGDVAAIKEVFNRVIGKPVETDLMERMEELEKEVERLTDRKGRK